GVRVEEPAVDLGVLLAVASSYRNRPLDTKTVFCGEVGLSGEVRGIPQLGRRLQEAAKLGFRRVVGPRVSLAAAVDPSIEVVGVGTVEEALALL
ncbi:MAG: magnesium chelatase domain-containing protein, partial [Armatimonadota bacterium]|nr:magnesium chelatase domain-containing protein [Armatimonadota bacterium]